MRIIVYDCHLMAFVIQLRRRTAFVEPLQRYLLSFTTDQIIQC